MKEFKVYNNVYKDSDKDFDSVCKDYIAYIRDVSIQAASNFDFENRAFNKYDDYVDTDKAISILLSNGLVTYRNGFMFLDTDITKGYDWNLCDLEEIDSFYRFWYVNNYLGPVIWLAMNGELDAISRLKEYKSKAIELGFWDSFCDYLIGEQYEYEPEFDLSEYKQYINRAIKFLEINEDINSDDNCLGDEEAITLVSKLKELSDKI